MTGIKQDRKPVRASWGEMSGAIVRVLSAAETLMTKEMSPRLTANRPNN